MLSDKQQKLLILALDSGAAKGEADNAAIKLVESLRKNGVTGYELADRLNGAASSAGGRPKGVSSGGADYGSHVLEFGKHKGKPIREVSLSYLLWIRDNLQDSRPRDVEIIKKFLA